MLLEFDALVYRWPTRREDWYFAALPEEISEEIREIPRVPRGFGSVRVAVQLGGSVWRTSIFPDTQRRTYVLPLKRAVRDAEAIADGDVVRVRLDLLDE